QPPAGLVASARPGPDRLTHPDRRPSETHPLPDSSHPPGRCNDRGVDTSPASTTGRRSVPLRLRPRSTVALAVASVAGLAMFLWPLLIHPAQGVGHTSDAPYLFVLILPALIGIVLAELVEGGMDAKA